MDAFRGPTRWVWEADWLILFSSTCGPVKSGSRSARRRRLEHLPTNTKDVVTAITLRTRICGFLARFRTDGVRVRDQFSDKNPPDITGWYMTADLDRRDEHRQGVP